MRSLLIRPVPPTLIKQEIPLDHPDSRYYLPSEGRAFLVTSDAAIDIYSGQTIMHCYRVLTEQARRNHGLWYKQQFKHLDEESLLFCDSGVDRQIFVGLESEYVQ